MIEPDQNNNFDTQRKSLGNGLYIIGNGFDLHHGLQTSYQHFAKWLSCNNRSLYDRCSEYLMGDCEKLWSEFEESFSYIDYDTICDEATDHLHSYGTENWSDSYHHDYEYEIEQITNDLSKNLTLSFAEWVTNINNTSFPLANTTNILPINPTAHFLSFNYTETLTKIYNVPTAQIKHIHGSCKQKEIVLGHAYQVAPDQFTTGIDRDTDPRVAQGYHLIQAYFQRTLKPTQEIIEQNNAYFECLQDASKVFVLGHSISEVDKPYFEKIVAVASGVPWIVSYYGEEERNGLNAILLNFGIRNFSLQEMSEIEF